MCLNLVIYISNIICNIIDYTIYIMRNIFPQTDSTNAYQLTTKLYHTLIGQFNGLYQVFRAD